MMDSLANLGRWTQAASTLRILLKFSTGVASLAAPSAIWRTP